MSVKTNTKMRARASRKLAEERKLMVLKRALAADLRARGLTETEVDMFLAAGDVPAAMPLVIQLILEQLAARRRLAEDAEGEAVF
jgi:hypothetical protein